jgi:hypothetical protein
VFGELNAQEIANLSFHEREQYDLIHHRIGLLLQNPAQYTPDAMVELVDSYLNNDQSQVSSSQTVQRRRMAPGNCFHALHNAIRVPLCMEHSMIARTAITVGIPTVLRQGMKNALHGYAGHEAIQITGQAALALPLFMHLTGMLTDIRRGTHSLPSTGGHIFYLAAHTALLAGLYGAADDPATAQAMHDMALPLVAAVTYCLLRDTLSHLLPIDVNMSASNWKHVMASAGFYGGLELFLFGVVQIAEDALTSSNKDLDWIASIVLTVIANSIGELLDDAAITRFRHHLLYEATTDGRPLTFTVGRRHQPARTGLQSFKDLANRYLTTDAARVSGFVLMTAGYYLLSPYFKTFDQQEGAAHSSSVISGQIGNAYWAVGLAAFYGVFVATTLQRRIAGQPEPDVHGVHMQIAPQEPADLAQRELQRDEFMEQLSRAEFGTVAQEFDRRSILLASRSMSLEQFNPAAMAGLSQTILEITEAQWASLASLEP